MTTAEILRKAAELVGPNGEYWWDGENATGPDIEICAALAIHQAGGGEDERTCCVCEDFKRLIGLSGIGHEPLYQWNDSRRSGRSVYRAMLKAADLAEREDRPNV